MSEMSLGEAMAEIALVRERIRRENLRMVWLSTPRYARLVRACSVASGYGDPRTEPSDPPLEEFRLYGVEVLSVGLALSAAGGNE